ncbi:MAG: leucyl aminopeptidase [Oscillibacter sp.]|nr:leucyl aminopeptidase [Oscillibacter sp.]
MVKLWNGEEVRWRLSLRLDGRPGDLEMGDEPRQMLVHLGKGEKLTAEDLRRAAAKAAVQVRKLGGASALVDAAPAVEALGGEGLSALIQGAELALYRNENWKQERKEEKPLALYLTGTEGAEAEKVLSETTVLDRWICFARDLVNRPANKLTPVLLAEAVVQASEKLPVEVQVLDEKETRALGMEAFHAVGDSSVNPPRLIVIRWRGGKEEEAPIALVGKGVCFDTGGYNLKTGLKGGMAGDMAGGASVCAAILALAENRVPVNVTAVIPAVENRISPDSFLPGDVIGSMSGKTIEIGSTDAEGRLILADAITYAIQKENACKVVDIATLTGAIARMLGSVSAGVMANNDGFFAELQAAAERSGEKFWRMPDYPEYKQLIESPVADLYNSSEGCGAIAAGLFLAAFAGETPWLHLDIAGTSHSGKFSQPYQPKGATGMGVSTMYRLCRDQAGK